MITFKQFIQEAAINSMAKKVADIEKDDLNEDEDSGVQVATQPVKDLKDLKVMEDPKDVDDLDENDGEDQDDAPIQKSGVQTNPQPLDDPKEINPKT